MSSSLTSVLTDSCGVISFSTLTLPVPPTIPSEGRPWYFHLLADALQDVLACFPLLSPVSPLHPRQSSAPRRLDRAVGTRAGTCGSRWLTDRLYTVKVIFIRSVSAVSMFSTPNTYYLRLWKHGSIRRVSANKSFALSATPVTILPHSPTTHTPTNKPKQCPLPQFPCPHA